MLLLSNQIKEFTSSVYHLRIFFCSGIVFCDLFNSKTCDDLPDKENLNPSICSRHSDEIWTKCQWKYLHRKKSSSHTLTLEEIINFQTIGDFIWLYVFLESLDLNVMEELMFTYFTIHAFCGVHQQETSSWLIDFEYKHQYWKICVHLILRIVDWR